MRSARRATATTGKGDGKTGATAEAEAVGPHRRDWKHGSTDGEIFTIIRDGAKQTGMRGYRGTHDRPTRYGTS